jgi:hypothetical protein
MGGDGGRYERVVPHAGGEGFGLWCVFLYTFSSLLEMQDADEGLVMGLAAYAFSQIPIPFVEKWLDGRA